MCKLYLIVDHFSCVNRSVDEVVQEAVAGGVDLVQLREKHASTRQIMELGRSLQGILGKYKIPLIINDRIDIARALNADGVHVGQQDMPYPIARQQMGEEKIVGVSVSSDKQALEANKWNVDYIGVGSVFKTKTKEDISALIGLDGLRRISKLSKHKIFAIGGIDLTNARSAIAAGADGIAVVSAICSAPTPKTAAQELLNIVKDVN